MAKYKVEMDRCGVMHWKYYDSYDRAKKDYDGLLTYAKWTHDYPLIIKLMRVDPMTREAISLLGVYKDLGVLEDD